MPVDTVSKLSGAQRHSKIPLSQPKRWSGAWRYGHNLGLLFCHLKYTIYFPILICICSPIQFLFILCFKQIYVNWLFIPLNTFVSDGADGWDNSDWGWKDEEEEKEKDEEEAPESNPFLWLTECSLSLSPAAEMMAIANDERLLLLSRRFSLVTLSDLLHPPSPGSRPPVSLIALDPMLF